MQWGQPKKVNKQPMKQKEQASQAKLKSKEKREKEGREDSAPLVAPRDQTMASLL